MKQLQAFTFIEMLIVLAIIAIVASLALPSFNFTWQRDQDEQIKLQILNAIQLARETAVLNGTSASLCKSHDLERCGGEWRDGLLVFANAAEDGVIKDKKQLISAVSFPKSTGQLWWRSFPYYRDYLLFSSAEITSINNGTFWYCPSYRKNPVWAIVLNKSSRERVEYPDKNGEIKDGRGKVLVC